MMSLGNHDNPGNLPTLTASSAPEIPRRPAEAETMSQGLAEGNAAVHTPALAAASALRQERVREVHKSAWLKWLHTSYDKKGVSFVKRSEKWWVVFCIHDDVDAFLEFYSEPKMSQVHKPTIRINLTQILHVSPSIFGHDNEFPFTVTFSSQAICLAASDWDKMSEWVDSLQGKLREMKILSPRDNLYSKLPEPRHCPINLGAISTRDPSSPLPPTPNREMSADVARCPQPQPISTKRADALIALNTDCKNQASVTGTVTNAVCFEMQSFGCTRRNPFALAWSWISQTEVNRFHSVRGNDLFTTNRVTDTTAVTDLGSQLQMVPLSESIFLPHTRSFEMIPSTTSVVHDVRDGTSLLQGRSHRDGDRILGNNVPPWGSQSSQNYNAAFELPRYNSTTKIGAESIPVQIGFGTNVWASSSPSTSSSLNHTASVMGGFPSNSFSQVGQKYVRRVQPGSNSIMPTTDPGVNVGDLILSIPARTGESSSIEFTRETSSAVDQNAARSCASSGNRYDPLTEVGVEVQVDDMNNVQAGGGHFPAIIPRQHANRKRMQSHHAEPVAVSPLVCEAAVQNLDNGGNATDESRQTGQNGSIVRSPLSTDELPRAAEPEESPLEGMFGLRRGEYRVAPGRDNNVVESSGSMFEASSASGGSRISKDSASSTHVPLKESQVMRLNLEINHVPGVRIFLRKRDCLGTIAFVDYHGAAWIAGWKQQEHPVLYYAFHIGDQILKVDGTRVKSSEEIRRAIKVTASHQVEFIIRRLPFGKVFVLKRKVEGEQLGLIGVGNCSAISEVVPNSLAAVAGLAPQATSVDGQSTCSWFLTEINNRPLSLFARESEVRDRLNAVGKEISILVQPGDLVKHLKKQLKTIRGFKDYLVV